MSRIDPLSEFIASLAGIDTTKVNSMEDNYDERVVARFEEGHLAVDTALVADNDPANPYETAVQDPHYSDAWIPVENSPTKEAAKIAHNKWVRIMTDPEAPPSFLKDVGTSESALAKDKAYGNNEWRTFQRKEVKPQRRTNDMIPKGKGISKKVPNGASR